MFNFDLNFLHHWTGNLALSIIIIFIIGTTSGTLAAYLGLGGGFIITPVLHGIIKLPAIEAISTSMTHIPFLMVAASIKYRKKIKYRFAFYILITAVPSAQVTAYLWNLFNQSELSRKVVFHDAALADFIVMATFILLSLVLIIHSFMKSKPLQEKSDNNPRNILLMTGVIMGFFSALLGIGGGFIVVPVLISILGVEAISATATSIFTILPVSFITAVFYYFEHHVHILMALTIAAGGIIGVQIGGKIAMGSDKEKLKNNIRYFHGILIFFYLTFRIFF